MLIDVDLRSLGDFNGDGTVDAADYTVWRDMGGTPEKYAEWKMHFGESAINGGSGSFAVPEPSGMLLLVIGVVGVLAPGRRRNRDLRFAWVIANSVPQGSYRCAATDSTRP